MNYQELWNRALDLLEERSDSFTNRTVYRPLEVLGGENHFLRLQCRDQIHLSFCKQNERLIQDVLFELSSVHFQIDFSSKNSPAPLAKHSVTERPSNGLNPSFTFDSFVVGNGNQFAYSVCHSIVNPHMKGNFNPLFIYGGSGLGKTHLIHAIGNYVQEHFPDKRVVYVQCETFLNEFIESIKTKSFETFRNKYRHCDYLLIDDIQFLQNKESTQEEFFHTFNTLYERNNQIIMTCDKPPQQLNSMEERLITRFKSGVMVDIQAPDYETRVAILNRLAEQNHIHLAPDVTDYIASQVSTNVRELSGAFKKISALTLLYGEVTLSMTMETLKDMVHPQGIQTITPDLILGVVCSYYNLTKSDLMSNRRDKKIAFPRQISMYFFRNILDMTYAQIGQFFNKKDHTTAKHNCDKIEALLKEKEAIEVEEIEDLRKKITP